MNTITTSSARALIGIFLLTTVGCASGGLSTRERSTLGGAALGAGAGAIVGQVTDHSPGKGALIGGAIGGLGGALVGDQAQEDTSIAQQRELERQRYETERQRQELEDLRRHDSYYNDYRGTYRDPYYDPRYAY